MLCAARRCGWGVALLALSAFGQDLGLDLTGDVDTGKPKLAVKLAQELTGAVLYVDELEIGPLPMDPVPISKGDHTISVYRPGWSDFTTTIKATKGTVSVTATLEPVGEAVNLTSDPDGADIVVDGKGKGKTPKVIALLPGKHDLRVVKDGYADWTYTIFTRAGRDTDLNAELKAAAASDRPLATSLEPEQVDPDLALRSRPRTSNNTVWYQRWYVWAGAAVVVAGAVTGVAVATHHHGGPPLDPGSVCGGPCDIVINSP